MVRPARYYLGRLVGVLPDKLNKIKFASVSKENLSELGKEDDLIVLHLNVQDFFCRKFLFGETDFGQFCGKKVVINY